MAGIAAVIGISRYYSNHRSDSTDHLRDIQSVLKDCYSKIEEIDEKVTNLSPQSPS